MKIQTRILTTHIKFRLILVHAQFDKCFPLEIYVVGFSPIVVRYYNLTFAREV